MPYVNYDSGHKEEYEVTLEGGFTIQELENILSRAKKDRKIKPTLLEGFCSPYQLRKIADEIEKTGD